MKTKDQQLLEEAYQTILEEYDPSQFDPRLNKADISNRPTRDYSEPKDSGPGELKRAEQNAGLGRLDKDDSDRYNPLYYAFKNDIIQRKKKVFWVFAGPNPGEFGSGQTRKWKDITSLVNSAASLEGQEFQGKFNKFKLFRITPKENQLRHKQVPPGIATASYKAVPAK